MSYSKETLEIGLDIETIPTQNEDTINSLKLAAAAASVSVPSSYNKADVGRDLGLEKSMIDKMDLPGLKAMWIDRFRAEAVEKSFQKSYRETSFSASRGGEVVAISVMPFLPGANVSTIYRYNGDSKTEVDLLNQITVWLDKINVYAKNEGKSVRIVGANPLLFDGRFLAQRMVINNLKLPDMGLRASRYDTSKYYDVLSAWCFDDSQSRIGLDSLARTLGIETPKNDQYGRIDGSMVWDIWRDGGQEGASRIAEYNARDVAILQPIFDRLIAMDGAK